MTDQMLTGVRATTVPILNDHGMLLIMKPSFLFFSALAMIGAPQLYAGQQAVQGIETNAAEVRIKYNDGVLVLRPIADDMVRVRSGEFPGLVRERLCRVVLVKPGRGIGALNAAQVDVEVRYTGAAITIPIPRE